MSNGNTLWLAGGSGSKDDIGQLQFGSEMPGRARPGSERILRGPSKGLNLLLFHSRSGPFLSRIP